MIICPPDCPKRTQGCHSNCEQYENNLAKYRERVDFLNKDRSVVGHIADCVRRRNNIYAKRKVRQRAHGRRAG